MIIYGTILGTAELHISYCWIFVSDTHECYCRQQRLSVTGTAPVDETVRNSGDMILQTYSIYRVTVVQVHMISIHHI